MEHLSPELRQKVIKMSEARLRQKLLQAGYREVDVAKFDRATLLEYYAKVLLTETAYVPAKEEQEEGGEAGDSDGEEKAEVAEGDAGVQHTAGGDQSAEEKSIVMTERSLLLEERKLEEQRLQREEQRLQREEQRLQREMEERRWQQQQEEQKMQIELQRMQLEQQREEQRQQQEEQRLQREQQREEQRMQRELEEKRLEVQRMQLEQQYEEQRKQREFQEMKWREDRAYKESTAVQIKTWGDALRNTITKMPSEGIDVVSWFVSIDKLFEQLNVPADLQAILIRPYLSDRAKLLMSKCDPTHSAKYESIKAFLLKELHLSPAVYLEKFNSLTQDKSETYSQFSTRLMSLFDYYVESRKVSQSYDKLIDLIVYDRVKSCLSPALSRYVLSLEANHKDGWIGRQGLAEALDSYLANLPESFGRPRFVPGLQAKTGSKPGNGKRETQPGIVVPERLNTRTASQYTDSQGQRPVPAPRPAQRRCYLCNSPTQLIGRALLCRLRHGVMP